MSHFDKTNGFIEQLDTKIFIFLKQSGTHRYSGDSLILKHLHILAPHICFMKDYGLENPNKKVCAWNFKLWQPNQYKRSGCLDLDLEFCFASLYKCMVCHKISICERVWIVNIFPSTIPMAFQFKVLIHVHL